MQHNVLYVPLKRVGFGIWKVPVLLSIARSKLAAKIQGIRMVFAGSTRLSTKQVFISSVMNGFETERAAAKGAVSLLRMKPVMAEDFGSMPVSSQLACLEGVRSADAFVLILGERYGWVAQSGKSVTEEEFEEARRCGLPILCFDARGKKEPQQATFCQRVKSYEEGYFVAHFDSPDALKDAVIAALNDFFQGNRGKELDASQAIQQLDKGGWGARKPAQFGTWLGIQMFPARFGEELISPVSLGKRELRDRLIQTAMFGEPPLFNPQSGFSHKDRASSVRFEQPDLYGRDVGRLLEIHSHGTVAFGALLGQQERGTLSLVKGHVIDEDAVANFIEAFLKYSNEFFNILERGAMLSSFFLGGSLSGTENKAFGKIPAMEVNSITMPSHRLGHSVLFPTSALKVSRADLGRAGEVARDIVERLGRRFREAGAYYTGPGPRF